MIQALTPDIKNHLLDLMCYVTIREMQLCILKLRAFAAQ